MHVDTETDETEKDEAEEKRNTTTLTVSLATYM